MTLLHRFGSFLRDEDGATAIEYALIISLIFLVIVTAVGLFATNMTTMFGIINTAMVAAL
jgi:pilus assembly protein Flp/PilA